MRFTLFRNLRPRSVYDVFAALALFVALGGTAYAVNTVRSTDIVDGEVKSADVANQDLTGGDIKDNSISSFDVGSLIGADVVDDTLTGADIRDDSLSADDVGAGVSNIMVNIGPVGATSCVNKPLGITGRGSDHIVLTPSLTDAAGGLVYDVRTDIAGASHVIHVCNFGGATVDDGITHFNVLWVLNVPLP